MNPSHWRKTAALVTQHKQEAAMAKTDHLSIMPLSEIAIDDSGPPVVHYGSHVPVEAHCRKILIKRSFQVSLRVYYTLLYLLLVQD